ncbi:hypothetical protein Verru16b_02556 [Lacunisphaera limnophila]|uniref:Uncharacterized protein n=1 Tax=Lacunisphaera limnophila TaxID=1838286 RepID=A0A1D8AX50_9BACT|nr:hypothetical protein [Lacunisphaera limnophila]AOS45475.1 hypothetical protein Verru16b_02556 [Lacunisphaera limnophila]
MYRYALSSPVDDPGGGPIGALLTAALVMAQEAPKAFRIEAKRRTRRGGGTLRPGAGTPLWNELKRRLRPHLRKYGKQANLGRLLGLPRQRVNAYVTGGGEMPDAERTLQLLVWLVLVERGKPPG